MDPIMLMFTSTWAICIWLCCKNVVAPVKFQRLSNQNSLAPSVASSPKYLHEDGINSSQRKSDGTRSGLKDLEHEVSKLKFMPTRSLTISSSHMHKKFHTCIWLPYYPTHHSSPSVVIPVVGTKHIRLHFWWWSRICRSRSIHVLSSNWSSTFLEWIPPRIPHPKFLVRSR